MSSAGHIYREQVFKFNNTGAGQKITSFDVENDAFIIFIEKTSGTTDIQVEVLMELPGDLTDISLDKANVDGDPYYRKAFVCSRRGKLVLSWEDDCNILVAIKMIGAAAVPIMNEQLTGTAASTEKLTKQFRSQVLQTLSQITESQNRIVNHLREIDDINEGIGDDF